MTNWEHIGQVRLAQADCLDALADMEAESVDAVIIDPPYCAGGYTEGGRTSTNILGASGFDWFQGDNMTTSGLVWLLRHVAIEAHRILRNKGSLCVFCDWRMMAALAPALESSGLRWRNMVVWDKLAIGMGAGGFRPRHEICLHFLKGSGVPKFATDIGNVIPSKRVPPKRKNHPTEKPQALLDAIIRATTPEGGTVVDVFCGGGSLAEAAVHAGRKAIVSDASATHIASARERITRLLLPMVA